MKKIKDDFIKSFGGNESDIRVFHAPGRVNLIGEHTDYNGGNVFPCALNFGTYGAVRKRDDNKLRFASGNFNLTAELDLNDLKLDQAHDWINYPKGVVNEFVKLGKKIDGFDLYVCGDVPNGAGLSSSASVELLTAVVVNSLFDCGLQMKEMVLLSQRAENQFVGVNCGVMDQYAVGMGKKGHAILLNCQALTHEYVPFELDGYKMVISNTNKQRGLIDSKYNERRSECAEALRILQQKFDIDNLCELSTGAFASGGTLIKDTIIYNRAAHAIFENQRTIDAVDLLKAWDITGFAKLMNASHESLKNLYEVSCFELDVMVDEALKINGVLGSRMTGAGFGGCTISIVKEEAVPLFIQQVGAEYNKKTALTADFYVAETGDGAGEIL